MLQILADFGTLLASIVCGPNQLSYLQSSVLHAINIEALLTVDRIVNKAYVRVAVASRAHL